MSDRGAVILLHIPSASGSSLTAIAEPHSVAGYIFDTSLIDCGLFPVHNYNGV